MIIGIQIIKIVGVALLIGVALVMLCKIINDKQNEYK